MKKICAFVLAAVLLVGLVACSSGVSQEEYDRVLQVNADLQDKINELGNETVKDSVKNAAISVIADQLGENYTCRVAGTDFVQYIIQIETDEQGIKSAYDNATFQLQVIKGLLEQSDSGTVGEALDIYASFYIKAVDDDGATVFELSYHPKEGTGSDISVGASYLAQVSAVILKK